jgi:TusA-related sulfurtransferase
VCPYTFVRAKLALEALGPGAVLRVVLDNETSARDVPRSLAGAGHRIVACGPAGPGLWVVVVRRGAT